MKGRGKVSDKRLPAVKLVESAGKGWAGFPARLYDETKR